MMVAVPHEMSVADVDANTDTQTQEEYKQRPKQYDEPSVLLALVLAAAAAPAKRAVARSVEQASAAVEATRRFAIEQADGAVVAAPPGRADAGADRRGGGESGGPLRDRALARVPHSVAVRPREAVVAGAILVRGRARAHARGGRESRTAVSIDRALSDVVLTERAAVEMGAAACRDRGCSTAAYARCERIRPATVVVDGADAQISPAKRPSEARRTCACVVALAHRLHVDLAAVVGERTHTRGRHMLGAHGVEGPAVVRALADFVRRAADAEGMLVDVAGADWRAGPRRRRIGPAAVRIVDALAPMHLAQRSREPTVADAVGDADMIVITSCTAVDRPTVIVNGASRMTIGASEARRARAYFTRSGSATLGVGISGVLTIGIESA